MTAQQRSASLDPAASSGFGSSAVPDLLLGAMEPYSQDVRGEVHLDLVMQHDGTCLYRLKERHDFPGLFEGVAAFSESDVRGDPPTVRLMIRYPHMHAAEYAPKMMAEWVIYRSVHLPIGF